MPKGICARCQREVRFYAKGLCASCYNYLTADKEKLKERNRKWRKTEAGKKFYKEYYKKNKEKYWKKSSIVLESEGFP
jgi:predicted amidophosphoribosyltransferase